MKIISALTLAACLVPFAAAQTPPPAVQPEQAVAAPAQPAAKMTIETLKKNHIDAVSTLRKQQVDEMKTFRETLKGKTAEEKKKAVEAKKAEFKAAVKALQADHKAQIEQFKKDNPKPTKKDVMKKMKL
ncbi:MAG TPA: hypothetical protein DCZ93_11200 [Elusimicrobia bacterium]|nr:MAG: hypothetical protein A2X35_09600 [Elusimicrobia bacterium GWA2_61_42]OGR78872.1 MAG: hypothetical protein A2X38_04590 [Elusimicrobia bacterium GWC2_61_25]HBB67841.1 hypothetical protein [Elusimicrobiota bacterium]